MTATIRSSSEVGRCRLFHRWTKWGRLQVGQKLVGGKPYSDLVYQERSCVRCNRVQMRAVAA